LQADLADIDRAFRRFQVIERAAKVGRDPNALLH
jgi:hypothetical protein